MVSADEDVMYPRPAVHGDRFQVFFCGSYIPLHGADLIVRAASLLERRGEAVDVVMVGTGQTFSHVRALAEQLGTKSVRFVGRTAYVDLPGLMAGADVCLGAFGTTAKLQRVIPNKVLDALAMAKPVVTADTPAVREVLVAGEHFVGCPPGDASALADAIVTLKHDDDLRHHVAARGHEQFKASLAIGAVSDRLAALVRSLVDG